MLQREQELSQATGLPLMNTRLSDEAAALVGLCSASHGPVSPRTLSLTACAQDGQKQSILEVLHPNHSPYVSEHFLT